MRVTLEIDDSDKDDVRKLAAIGELLKRLHASSTIEITTEQSPAPAPSPAKPSSPPVTPTLPPSFLRRPTPAPTPAGEAEISQAPARQKFTPEEIRDAMKGIN